MRDLGTVMEQLRRVREARRSFLRMWRVERDFINPLLDRMADDLKDVTVTGATSDDDDPGQQPPPAQAGD